MLETGKIKKILIRSTNWVGDAVMTTPAVRTVRENFPKARITILCYPWVADVFAASPHVDEVMIFDPRGAHRGAAGLLRLSSQLRKRGFDAAILLQNAFKAALIAFLTRIPVRAGYIRDGRRPLLTHPVPISPETRKKHQVHYYQDLCRGLGMKPGPDELFLDPGREAGEWAAEKRQALVPEGRLLVGLNPGAAYGPAKRWPVEKYAALAVRLADEMDAAVAVFGTDADRGAGREIAAAVPGRCLDLTGRTSLAQAMAMIGQCGLFVTNDSGLMHVAAALKVPLAAIFGSTDPVATGPFSENARVVRHEFDCQPCFATDCKRDFRCMTSIGVDDVMAAAVDLLAVS